MKLTKANASLTAATLAVCAFTLIPATARTHNQPSRNSPQKSKVVYVCACLKTKSCSCMTEAKMEGPCACGTEGGPPMKAVPSDSDWAKQNRDALAK
jgi:hypothetical protein